MRLTTDQLAPYVDQIRNLPFVKSVEVLSEQHDPKQSGFDAVVRIETAHQRHELLVEIKRTNLTRPLIDGLLAQSAELAGGTWILFAPYISRPMGEHLAAHGANYVDAAGNCHLRIGEDHIALIEGKRRPRRKGLGRGIGVAGYRALFAILACPDLLNAPVRILAEAAEIGKSAAAETIERLISEGLVGSSFNRRQILDRRTLMDRWLSGYATMVRPRLLIGNFQTPYDTPELLEDRIHATFQDDLTWVWGGGAAAMRLTGHYRGETTTLHVDRWTSEHTKRLRALPAPNGPLAIVLAPGKAAFDGAVPRTAHPLLVYTELLTLGTARAREAAAEFHAEYLRGADDAAP